MSRFPPIAGRADLDRIEAAGHAAFVRHASVYAALASVAEQQSERPALAFIRSGDPAEAPQRWTHAQFMADDGWLITGDIGHVDEQCRIFVTGRTKDVIIRSSHNIDPGMIEKALLAHPAVQMAAAIGEPDEYAGELPVAFVVLKPGSPASAEELLAFASVSIAERAAVPKRITVLESLPLTAIGKVYKPALRVRATASALQERARSRGVATTVQVEETPAGMAVLFAGGNAAELAVLMKPFALPWSRVES